VEEVVCRSEINEWGRYHAVVKIPSELEAYSIGIARYRGAAVWRTVFVALKDGRVAMWWNDPDSLETYCEFVDYDYMLKKVYKYKRYGGAEIQFKNVPESVMKDLEELLRTPTPHVATVKYYFKPEKEPITFKSPWVCDVYYDPVIDIMDERCTPRNPSFDWIARIEVKLHDTRFKDDIEFLLKPYKHYGAVIEYV
jgi:uncharacterized protein (DUF608 family)